MAIDVFDVFDRQSEGSHTPPPGPRFQAARTIFAVSVAIAVLVAMCWGAFALFRGITKGDSDVALCTAAELQDQAAQAAWLRDGVSVATGTTDTPVIQTGCSKATASLPIGARTYLVNDEDLSGAVGVLTQQGCEMKLSAAKSGTCTTTIDKLPVTVNLAKAPGDAAGDYVWSVTAVTAGA